jgi:amidohydrolase
MKTLDKEILEIADCIAGDLTNIRRDFHKHPELGFKEKRTAQKITEYLSRLEGITIETGIGKTGVTGVLKCRENAPVTALRADIDAVPMEEKNDVPYKSVNKEAMHSCGHDGHAAILLGAASILSKLRDKLPVNVKFMYQPAEEEALGGAKAMIKDKVLQKDNVTSIFGFHLNATADFGEVGVLAGPVMAGATKFNIIVNGKGGHSAYPEKCTDALLVANNIYNSLQTIHKNIHASQACVISVCSMNTGSATSGIPEKVEMNGAIRTLDKKVQETVVTRMREIVAGMGKAFGVECLFSFEETYLPTFNSPELCDVIRKGANDLQFTVNEIVPSMGSDDFSFYLEKIPGAYMTFGINKGKNFPVAHNSYCDFDEKILPIGAAMLAKCVLR